MIEYLGHKLINSPAPNFADDMVCCTCKVRLEPATNYVDKLELPYNLILDYVFNEKAGKVIKNYNLTCEEQQIKNLLE